MEKETEKNEAEEYLQVNTEAEKLVVTEAEEGAAAGLSWWKRRQVIFDSSPITTTASSSFFLLLLLFVSIAIFFVITRGFDTTSPFTSISFRTPFQPIKTRPPDYPHIDPYPLNCTTTKPPHITFTCPANYNFLQPNLHPHPPRTCPSYFRWIHEDLKPWKTNNGGITSAMLDEIENNKKFRHFRLTIVNGTAYVKRYEKAFQTRDVFTLWGILQLLKMYPGQIPDLDLMFQCHDQPSIRKTKYGRAEAPPLFHYCGSDDTYDIVFPDWSFWGWPEINIKPWVPLKKDLEQGNKLVNWTDRQPYAYWRGNLYTGPRRKLGPCNSTHKWKAQIYYQDWGKEIREGFKNSDMSKQCKHRYKLYMEGNAWSVSEKYILACDSMSLLVNPVFYDFFTRTLVPLKHYWPINPKDLCRSIKFAVEWGDSHPEQAQEIGREGSRFVQEEIVMHNVYDYMFHLLSEYGKLMAYRPTVPPGAVKLCSDKWVCASGDLEKIYKIHTMVKRPAEDQPCKLPPPFKQKELTEFVKEKGRNVRRVEAWKNGEELNP